MADRQNVRHGNLREAMLKRAESASRINGPNAIGIREIAREEGVTPGAAYRHFSGLDELVADLGPRLDRKLAHQMKKAVESASTSRNDQKRSIARLRALVHSYLDFARRNPGWFQIIYSRGPAPDPEIVPFSDTTGGQLAGILDELLAAGQIVPLRRENAELFVWVSIHGLAVLQIGGPLARLSAQEREDAERFTVDTILHAFGA